MEKIGLSMTLTIFREKNSVGTVLKTPHVWTRCRLPPRGQPRNPTGGTLSSASTGEAGKLAFKADGSVHFPRQEPRPYLIRVLSPPASNAAATAAV